MQNEGAYSITVPHAVAKTTLQIVRTWFRWNSASYRGVNADNKCMFVKGDTSDCDKLYSLDVLGVENRGEDDQLQVYEDFKENIVRRNDGRYEVSVPWIIVSELSGTNEQASRGRIPNVERKLRKKSTRRQWRNRLATGINEKALQTCIHWRAYLASICYKSQESERM